MLLGLLPLGDVAGDLRRPDDAAAGVSNRRDGQRNVNQNSILALAHGFIAIDRFAAPNTLQNPRLLIDAVCGDQQCGRLSDGFFRCVPEEALGSLVKGLDDAL